MTSHHALYAGSFDPFTNGHLSVLRAGLRCFDNVTIAIGVHSSKKGVFSYDERKTLIETVLAEDALDASRVQVTSFDGLVVDAAKARGATILLRGLRDGHDLAYEMQMAGMNATMAADIQTVFMPADVSSRPITATLVRQIAAMGGDVTGFVPPAVAKALADRFSHTSN